MTMKKKERKRQKIKNGQLSYMTAPDDFIMEAAEKGGAVGVVVEITESRRTRKNRFLSDGQHRKRRGRGGRRCCCRWRRHGERCRRLGRDFGRRRLHSLAPRWMSTEAASTATATAAAASNTTKISLYTMSASKVHGEKVTEAKINKAKKKKRGKMSLLSLSLSLSHLGLHGQTISSRCADTSHLLL